MGLGSTSRMYQVEREDRERNKRRNSENDGVGVKGFIEMQNV